MIVRDSARGCSWKRGRSHTSAKRAQPAAELPEKGMLHEEHDEFHDLRERIGTGFEINAATRGCHWLCQCRWASE